MCGGELQLPACLAAGPRYHGAGRAGGLHPPACLTRRGRGMGARGGGRWVPRAAAVATVGAVGDRWRAGAEGVRGARKRPGPCVGGPGL